MGDKADFDKTKNKVTNNKTTSIEDLPTEVMEQILSRCGVESVVRCKFVCKPWESIISDTHFHEIHRLQRSKMCENEKVYVMLGKSIAKEAGPNHDHVYFMKLKDGEFSVESESYDDLLSTYVVPTSYCNGLFILRSANPNNGKYMLLNPGIHKHTIIQGPTTDADADPTQDEIKLYHLYYDSEVDDYKFVLIVKYSNNKRHYYMVYSCKDCRWGERKDLPNGFQVDVDVAVDGCFYYYYYYYNKNKGGYGEIECFDSRDGKLDKFMVPEGVEGDEVKYLMENSGHLCLCSARASSTVTETGATVTRRRYLLWVMEKKHCWRKINISKGGGIGLHLADMVGFRFVSRIPLSNNIEDDVIIYWDQSPVGGRYAGDGNGFILILRRDVLHNVKFDWSCSTPLYPYFDNLYLPPTTTTTDQIVAL